MKKVVLALAVLAVSVFGYSASGEPSIKITGYKTAAKTPVDGTFKKVTFMSKADANFAKFLQSLSAKIDTMSIETKMPLRNNNISSTLFQLAEDKEIMAVVKKAAGDDKKGTLDMEISFNKVKKMVKMNYQVAGGVLKAMADIDILDFNMQKPFDAFSTKCKGLHSGKTWSEFKIEFDLPVKK